MGLKDDIDSSKKLLTYCSELIDNVVEVNRDTLKKSFPATLFQTALEHHSAIQLLVSHTIPLNGSAAALLRPQFEAYIRGVWLHRCAKDSDIKKFCKEDKLPKIDLLIEQIEKLPAFANGVLSKKKKELWNIMCSLIHGGMLQITNRISATEIADNYTDEQVSEILNFACSVTQMVLVGLAGLIENTIMANEIYSTCKRLFSEKT